jgi:hypothetical protein
MLAYPPPNELAKIRTSLLICRGWAASRVVPNQSKCRQLSIDGLLPHPHKPASTIQIPTSPKNVTRPLLIDWKATCLLLLRKEKRRYARRRDAGRK